MNKQIKELVTATDAWCDQNFPPDWTERVDEFLPLWNEKFAALVAAAEREKVAAWMIERDYATGHGDTIEGLLKALEWQAKERARGFL